MTPVTLSGVHTGLASELGLAAYGRRIAEAIGSLEATDRAGAVVETQTAVDRAVASIASVRQRKAKLLFIGNGGSAAIASHQAADFWKAAKVRALAFNDASLLTAVSNDCSYAEVFERPIEMFAEPGDLLVALSSSGASANILRGAAAAHRLGCEIITLSGFDARNALRGLGDLNFYVPASQYGVVEISHLSICHHLLERVIAGAEPRDQQLPPQPRIIPSSQ